MHDAYTRNKLEQEQKYIVTHEKHHALKSTAPHPLLPVSQLHTNAHRQRHARMHTRMHARTHAARVHTPTGHTLDSLA